jgi:DNA transposition AAA+ family ATPase
MSANYPKSSGAFSQGGYMNSAELTAVRGVSAVPVAFRAAALLTAVKRDFIWYLQGLSLRDGGFKRLARELVEMFPNRISKADVPKALTFVERVKSPHSFYDEVNIRELSIEQLLTELCTNPKVQFSLPGCGAVDDEFETEWMLQENPEFKTYDLKRAELIYFRDIIGALVEYRAQQRKAIRDNFHLTAIGKKIWETIEYALASKSMVLLDGMEGRGKTEAVKACCELHSGQLRFVSLTGITTKTAILREISMALGITYAYGRTGPEMQSRIEDVLRRSKIMLVIDEAHFLFNQSRHMTTRPEMIDWLDTAICNRGVPVALVTTPQFIQCLMRAKNQVDWNFKQFRRRVKRWVKLPDKNTEADLFAVAQSVFQNANETVIKKVVGYALLSKRDLSAIGDIAAEVRAMTGNDDLSRATVAHVDRAMKEFLMASDLAFDLALVKAEADQRKGRPRPMPPALQVEVAIPEPLESDQLAAGRETQLAPALPRSRSGLAVPALETADQPPNRSGLKADLTAA